MPRTASHSNAEATSKAGAKIMVIAVTTTPNAAAMSQTRNLNGGVGLSQVGQPGMLAASGGRAADFARANGKVAKPANKIKTATKLTP